MKILTTLTLIMLTITAPGQTGSQGNSAPQGSSAAQASTGSQESSDLQVIDFGWAQHVTSPATNVNIDAGGNTPVVRTVPRTSTLRTTVPERIERRRDTNARMSDLHSLESAARASQAEQIYSTPRLYYEYYIRVKNAGGKLIQNVYWQYEIEHRDGQEPFIRQIFCKSKLKPDETTNLRMYSFSSPRKVIKVSNREGASVMKGDEHVVINRIQFSDGTFWERPNWTSTTLSESAAKKVGGGQCISL